MDEAFIDILRGLDKLKKTIMNNNEEGHEDMDGIKQFESEQVRLVVNQAIAACVAALVVDIEMGTIIGASPTADTLFGYMEGELIGKLVHDLVPGRLRSAHQEHVSGFSHAPKARRMGGASQTILIGLRRDGTEFPVAIGLYPRVVAGKRAVVATVLDMSRETEEKGEG